MRQNNTNNLLGFMLIIAGQFLLILSVLGFIQSINDFLFFSLGVLVTTLIGLGTTLLNGRKTNEKTNI